MLAYALYTRDLLAVNSASADAARLIGRVGMPRLQLDAAGWLLSVLADDNRYTALADSLRTMIRSRATETAGRATFSTTYREGEYLLLPSTTRTDAIVLDALISADPRSDLIPKTVRELLARRRGDGAWRTTQENAWALLALDRYFNIYERATPAFDARVWLGERYAGGQRFEGRSTEQRQIAMPMRALTAAAPDTARGSGTASNVTIAKEGAGRMYYRAALRYAPTDLDLAPDQRGFAVERGYAAVDDSADVRRGADGRWRIRAGARVRVTLTLTAPAARYHVVLSDPLPADFEAINPELRGAESGSRVRQQPGGEEGWHWWRWYDHYELRDDRVAAFATELRAGVYTFSYVARATTPGLYVAAPTRAEEMYEPETFGRGGTERVIVVEEAPAPRR